MGRRQHVVGRQHQHAGLGLGFGRQRQVHRHLVAVEVGVERRAHERVDLDGLALDEYRLEGLDAEAVQGRRPVEHHRVLLDHVFEHLPHLGATTLDHPLGRLDVLGELLIDEPLHDERLEQLERHDLRQTALVELQRRSDDDDGAARVVDALAEQVLAEPALLALQHVGERLEGTVAGTGDRTTTTAVVEQRVDRLLEHPLLVVDDDLRCTEVEETLEAVVPVDDPSIQVVQIGGGEAAAVELHHRPELGWDHRHDVEDHRPRIVLAAALLVAPVERSHDLEPLDRLLLALGRQWLGAVFGLDREPELQLLIVEVDPVDQLSDRVGAHTTLEIVAESVDHLTPQHLVFENLAGEELLELLPGSIENVELHFVLLAGGGELLFEGALTGPDLGVLGTVGLHAGDFLLELFVLLGQAELHLLRDGLALADHLRFEVGEILGPLLLVDPGHEVGGEVDHLLELLGLELLARLRAHEQVGQPRAGAAQIPDVHARRRRARCGPCARGGPSSASPRHRSARR